MRYDHFMFGDRLMDMHVREEHWKASIRRMAREARPDRKERLSERWALGLYRLGNVLEKFGLWLQRDTEPHDSVVAG